MVLSLSLLKELYEDLKRHQRDKILNKFKYTRATRDGNVEI